LVDFIEETDFFIKIMYYNSLFFIKNEIKKKIKKKKYKKFSIKTKNDIILQSKNLISINKLDFLKQKNVNPSTYYYWVNHLNCLKQKESKNINFMSEIIIISVYRFLIQNEIFLDPNQQMFLFYLVTDNFYNKNKINIILKKNRLSFKKIYKRNYSQSNLKKLDMNTFYDSVWKIFENEKSEILFQDETHIMSYGKTQKKFTNINTESHFEIKFPDKKSVK
jgi:hypothetical protein